MSIVLARGNSCGSRIPMVSWGACPACRGFSIRRAPRCDPGEKYISWINTGEYNWIHECRGVLRSFSMVFPAACRRAEGRGKPCSLPVRHPVRARAIWFRAHSTTSAEAAFWPSLRDPFSARLMT
jgi:hypothetical protein